MNEVTKIQKRGTSSKSTRLAARVIGTIWLSIGLFFLIGSLFEHPKTPGAVPKPPDILGIATIVCMLIAFGGLILAWWKEGLGGFISLSGFIIAGALLIIDPDLNFSLPIFVILMVPSILYLVYWWDERKLSAGNSKS
jgi:hypothetical protein